MNYNEGSRKEYLVMYEYFEITSWISLVILAVFIALMAFINKLPKKKFSFAARVMIGTGCGLVYGGIIRLLKGAVEQSGTYGAAQWLQLFSYIYISMFRVLILPALFIAMTNFVIHSPGKEADARLQSKKKQVTIAMLVLASFIGLMMGWAFGVGTIGGEQRAAVFYSSLPQAIRSVLYLDYSGIFLFGSVAVVIFMGFLAGSAAKRMSGKYMDTVKPFFDLMNALLSIMTSMLKTVIAWKPMGAFAIMAGFTAVHGLAGIMALVKFLAVLYGACLLMLVLQIVISAAYGMSPARFLSLGKPVMIQALKTRSGGACIGMVKEILSGGMGLCKEVTDDVSGYTINSGMQGCASLFPSMAAVFALSVMGIPMSWGIAAAILILVVLVSYAITSLPGTATLSEFAVLMGTGIEGTTEGLGPMIALDPVADVPRTLLNVTGSMVNAIIVERKVRK